MYFVGTKGALGVAILEAFSETSILSHEEPTTSLSRTRRPTTHMLMPGRTHTPDVLTGDDWLNAINPNAAIEDTMVPSH